MIRIYLAGHVNEVDYRAYVNEKYRDHLEILDPLQEVEQKILNIDLTKYEDLTKVEFTAEEKLQVVELDKQAVASSDILVAYITKFTCGTVMEVLHAWNKQIPVYVINPGGTLKNDIWLGYHTSKFFNTIDECFENIINSF